MSNTISEKREIRKYNNFTLSKEELEKEYAELGSCEKIGNKYGVSGVCVRNCMRKYDLPVRTFWSRGKENYMDLTGQKFGKLTVKEKSPRMINDNGCARWICKCECGNEVVVIGRLLRKGLTKSCGCLRKEKTGSYKYEGISHFYWRKVLRGAEIRSLTVEITPQQAWEKFIAQNKKCALSGVDLVLLGRHSDSKTQTASLDRIDSSKGYTLNNIQWLHKDINIMKSNFSDSDFVEWCKKVYVNAAYGSIKK